MTTAARADWTNIRDEYETTSISIRELARRWGFKSDNSIRQKIKGDGWKKDDQAITANLVTQAITGAPFDSDETQDDDPQGTHENPAQEDMRTYARRHAQEGENAHPDPKGYARQYAQSRRPAEHVRQDAQADQAVARARGLATLQAEAVRKQLKAADGIDLLADAIETRLTTALLAKDPDEKFEAVRALLSINPEKETMAGLLKSLELLKRTGVDMRRRALGMDLKVMVPGGSTPVPASPVQKVLDRMSTEALLKLREATQEIARLPPLPPEEIIEGHLGDEETP